MVVGERRVCKFSRSTLSTCLIRLRFPCVPSLQHHNAILLPLLKQSKSKTSEAGVLDCSATVSVSVVVETIQVEIANCPIPEDWHEHGQLIALSCVLCIRWNNKDSNNMWQTPFVVHKVVALARPVLSLLGLLAKIKCSICSYQLNIWYESHGLSSILNWFLDGDGVSVACYGSIKCWPCIAVPQGSAHFPTNE